MASAIAFAADLWLALGALVATAFLLFGVGRISGEARRGSIGFRLILLPSCVLLWPLVLVLWRRAPKAGAEEAP